ncbi:MAG: DUF5107 domain-containing protein, partial [Acidobacteriota bacterium]|nr:DUF5107 domain-containing protein [Acidobacteriota bacterium]
MIVEDTDRVSGMTWRDEFILRPGSAVLEQRVTLHNGTEARRGFQWWADASVEFDDPRLRFIYPVNWMLPHGSSNMTAWPVDEAGKDISLAAAHQDGLGLFGHGTHEPWMAVYKPTLREGLVHYADPESVRGKKLWLWGSDDTYVKENLTEKFNSYVEMQAGLMETQTEFAFLFPGETRVFTHFWIPLRDMGGISRATPDAVMNLGRAGQAITLEVLATHAIRNATILLRDGPKKVFEARADLDPKTKFIKSVTTAANTLTLELLDSSGRCLVQYMEGRYDSLPFNAKGKVPDPQPPPPAADSEADLIARASFNEQRDQFPLAWADYRTGLAKYPASTLLALGAGRTAFTLHRFDDAIRLLAPLSAPEANWYYGAALAATGRVAEAKSAFYRAALDVAYKDAATFRIALLTGSVQTIQSVADPGAFEVAILRRAGQTDAAKAKLKLALDGDPADNLLRAERVLLSLPDDPPFWSHLAADPERVLNLADSYFSLGAYDDALRFLDRQYAPVPASETEPGAVLPQNNPLVLYYRGYARSKLGQNPAADFKAASALPILYIFPSRASSIAVLNAALAKNDSDATAHALAGDLALLSLDEDQADRHWRKALSLNPGLPGIRAALKDPKEVKEVKKDVAPPPPAPTGDIAADALIQSTVDPERASTAFTNANFPKEKQSEEVRRAYIETQLQRLFFSAGNGRCDQALANLDTLGDENKELTFTMYGFAAPMRAAHFQYYLGLVENACGADKAAKKRWAKLSKTNEPAASLEFVFPLLAARSLGGSDWQRRVAAALQALKGDAPATLFARGALLIAAGKHDEGDELLQQSSRADDPMLRYLSLVT